MVLLFVGSHHRAEQRCGEHLGCRPGMVRVTRRESVMSWKMVCPSVAWPVWSEEHSAATNMLSLSRLQRFSRHISLLLPRYLGKQSVVWFLIALSQNRMRPPVTLQWKTGTDVLPTRY